MRIKGHTRQQYQFNLKAKQFMEGPTTVNHGFSSCVCESLWCLGLKLQASRRDWRAIRKARIWSGFGFGTDPVPGFVRRFGVTYRKRICYVALLVMLILCIFFWLFGSWRRIPATETELVEQFHKSNKTIHKLSAFSVKKFSYRGLIR